jgi:predicted DNA binding protein
MNSIQNHPSLKELHILKESACCIDLETRTFDPLLLQAIVKNSILVNLPVVIQGGIANFEVSGSRENINEFIEFLESRNVKCQLKEIGEFSQNTDYLLTPRQQEIFDAAKKSGFFEVPRKINLTSLAESLGMAKSTLSSMMQRIYAKLLGN